MGPRSRSVAVGRGHDPWQDLGDDDQPDFSAVDDDRHGLARLEDARLPVPAAPPEV